MESLAPVIVLNSDGSVLGTLGKCGSCAATLSVTSPSHSKTEGRKHPSIISSTFFSSSKKFPLQPFQALASAKEFRKRNASLQSKNRHSSFFGDQANISIEKSSDPCKVNKKVSILEKPSYAHTLKDHLYQCPSKLSEELVRCIPAIYCWLQTATTKKPEKNCSPLLSRSSTNVILPRRSSVENREWSCKSSMEISWISIDKNQFSHASYAINSYRSVRKIVNLDSHIGLACVGLKTDARVLINKARMECQSHRLTVEDPMTVEYITRYIGIYHT